MIVFKVPASEKRKEVLRGLIQRMRSCGYSIGNKTEAPSLWNTEGAYQFGRDSELYNQFVNVTGDLLPALNAIQSFCKGLNIIPKIYLDWSGAYEELEYLLVEL